MIYCTNCEYKTSTKKSMQYHCVRKHNICFECNVQVPTRKDYLIHLKLKHENLQCDKCSNEFLLKYELKQHQKMDCVKTGLIKYKAHQCDQCDYKAVSPAHLKKHCALKHFICNVCNLQL